MITKTIADLRKACAAGEYDLKRPYPRSDAARIKWVEDSHKLEENLKLDLEFAVEDLGVPMLYSTGLVEFAWREGHSSGYQEVLNHAEDLAITIFLVGD